jgi:xanthine dehydrogenase accessory factor
MDSSDLMTLDTALGWLDAGHRVMLATVVQTWGSSPRPPGAWAAFCDDGRVAGSVSGGCIEDDLATRARGYGGAQAQPEVVRYGVTRDEADRFGLPCGGTLRLVLEQADSATLRALQQRLARRELVKRVVNLHTGHSTLHPAEPEDELFCDDAVLHSIHGPRWRLLIIGAGQTSVHLASMATALDYAVTVCDPREEYRGAWPLPGIPFTTEMPDDAVTAMHPDARTAIVALTHDPKLDDLALIDALQSRAFYVGALGSRVNQEARKARLREHFDLTPEQLSRLYGPVGLPIGSRTPGEIAVSILAGLTAAKNGADLPGLGLHLPPSTSQICA